MLLQGGLIGLHELTRSGFAAQRYFLRFAAPKIPPHHARLVAVFLDVAKPDAGHGLSHSFGPSSSPSMASKARSSCRTSQTTQESNRFGLGIRPSRTSSSNLDGLTPTYSAASGRRRPRRGHSRGRSCC